MALSESLGFLSGPSRYLQQMPYGLGMTALGQKAESVLSDGKEHKFWNNMRTLAVSQGYKPQLTVPNNAPAEKKEKKRG